MEVVVAMKMPKRTITATKTSYGHMSTTRWHHLLYQTPVAVAMATTRVAMMTLHRMMKEL